MDRISIIFFIFGILAFGISAVVLANTTTAPDVTTDSLTTNSTYNMTFADCVCYDTTHDVNMTTDASTATMTDNTTVTPYTVTVNVTESTMNSTMGGMCICVTETVTEGETVTVTERETETVTEGETVTVPEGETVTVTEGETVTVTEGETVTVPEGETVTVTEGETVTVTEGETVTVPEGETVTVTEGETVTVTEGEAVTVTEGETVTVTEGETVTVPEGETVTVTEGDTASMPTGVVQNMSSVSSDNLWMSSERTSVADNAATTESEAETTEDPADDDDATFVDESETLEIPNVNDTLAVASALEDVSEDIQASSLADIPAETLADPEVLESILDSDASTAVIGFVIASAVGVLRDETINTSDCSAHQAICIGMSEGYINGLSNAEIDCVLDNEGHCTAYESHNTRTYFASRIADRINGTTRAGIEDKLDDYKCYLDGLTSAQWDTILQRYGDVENDDPDSDDYANFNDSVTGRECGSHGSVAITEYSEHFDIEFEVDATISEVEAATLTPDDIRDDLAPEIAVTVFAKVDAGLELRNNDERVTKSTPEPPSAVLLKLKELIDVSSLNEDALSDMAGAGGVDPSDIANITDNTLCDDLDDYDYLGLFESGAINQAYDKCNTFHRGLTLSSTEDFGVLLAGASVEDILAVTDNTANYRDVVQYFCSSSGYFSRHQLEALGSLVKAYYDANDNDDEDMTDVACALPYADNAANILSAITNDTIKTAVCYELACIDITQLAASEARDILRECIEGTSVSLAQMSCTADDRSLTLISVISADQLQDESTSEIVRTLDNLQLKVADCDARERLLSIVHASGEIALNTLQGLARIGSLVDQVEPLTGLSWDNIPESERCGLESLILFQLEQQHEWVVGRQIAGTTTVGFECFDLENRDLADLRSRITPDSCSSSSKRRRRSADISCADILEVGTLAPYIFDESDLVTLTDFDACADTLGAMTRFHSGQLAVLATLAINAYGASDTWTTEQTVSLGGIVSGLSTSQLDDLMLSLDNASDALTAIGWSGIWTPAKLAAVFGTVLESSDQEISEFRTSHLQVMGEIVCGMSSQQLAMLSPEEFCGACYFIGHLTQCDAGQLSVLVTLAKNEACFGTDVTNWPAATIGQIGTMIGGFSESEYAAMTDEQIQNINPTHIQYIPASSFNAFTLEQLGNFSVLQLGQMSPEQFRALSSAKQDAVTAALGNIASEVSLDTTDVTIDDNDNSCSFIEESLTMIALTCLFAWLLRI